MVTHSMGNHFSMRTLTLTNDKSDALKWIENIIFAAPDVPVAQLRDALSAADLEGTCPNYTLYYSTNDYALVASFLGRIFSPDLRKRAGRDGIMLKMEDQLRLQTLDASDTNSISHLTLSSEGHSYYLDETPVIKDMVDVVNSTPKDLLAVRKKRNNIDNHPKHEEGMYKWKFNVQKESN